MDSRSKTWNGDVDMEKNPYETWCDSFDAEWSAAVKKATDEKFARLATKLDMEMNKDVGVISSCLITAVQTLRPCDKDIIVLKVENLPDQALIARMRESLSKHLGFPVLILFLGPNDDVSLIRYQDANALIGSQ